MVSSSFSPFSRQVTNLTLFSRTSSPHHLHHHLHHQQFSLITISTISHPAHNAPQPHISSLINCGLAAAIPSYSSRLIIHRIHVPESANSSSVGLTCSQDRHCADIPIEPRDGEPSLSGQRRSIGVAGPNFGERLRRFLALKNGHISGLEERIQTLERKNGETLLDLWRFKCKYTRLKRQLRREVFRLRMERSFILFLLFFL